MGLLSSLFGGGGKDEVRIEGRKSSNHTHKDGSKGHDVYAAKVSYRDGGKVSEKNADWGHVSVKEDGSKSGHVK